MHYKWSFIGRLSQHGDGDFLLTILCAGFYNTTKKPACSNNYDMLQQFHCTFTAVIKILITVRWHRLHHRCL